MVDYPPSGSLFEARNRKSEKSPDYSGYMEFTYEVIEDLVKQMKEGVQKPKCNLVSWKKMGIKSGKPFLSIRGNIWEEPKQNGYQSNNFQNNTQPQPSPSLDAIDDEIPF